MLVRGIMLGAGHEDGFLSRVPRELDSWSNVQTGSLRIIALRLTPIGSYILLTKGGCVLDPGFLNGG